MDKETKHVSVKAELKTEGDAAGTVSAVFSTFDVVDSDGDIVVASAFENGQQVPMAWAHDWREPVGKGAIHVTPEHARFDGAFFLQTERGNEAYKTTKAMGDLQEWSWGFRVSDARYEERDGQSVRVILKADVYEVSPVLKGAGVGTYTQSIKASPEGMTYADQAEAALAAVKALVDRTEALAAVRAQDGRRLSDAHMARLAALKDDLERIIGANVAPMPAKEAERLLLEYQRTRAMLAGVAVGD